MLCIAVGGVLAVQTANQQWSGDVWEHLAVVSALADDLLDPAHPILAAGDAPHPFVSPYTTALGALTGWSGLDPVRVLQLAAFANLALFLVAFRLFVQTVTDNRLAPFWGLLFALFLWGLDPWRYSGFVGMNAIGFGLPYPSMFALSMALLSLWTFARYGTTRLVGWLAWFVAGSALTILTHPPTAAMLVIGSIALAGRYRIPRDTGEAGLIGVALLGAAGLVVAWPGYPFLELLGETSVYDATNRVMYDKPLLRIAPALAGAVVIALRSRRNWRDPLGLMLAGSVVVYGLGWLTDQWTWGRVMAFGALVMQIGLAAGIADLERAGRLYRRSRPWLAPALAGLLLLVGIGVATTAPGSIRGVPTPLLPAGVEARFYRSPSDVAEWESVLAGGVVATQDPEAQEIAPALGARVVYSHRPLAFVDDLDERAAAQLDIFSGDADERQAAIGRYGATHLVTRGPPPAHLRELGSVLPLGDGFHVILLP